MSEKPQDEQEFTAEDILNDYKVSGDPIVINLPDGRKLTFSPLPTSKARSDLNKQIDGLLKTVPGVEDQGYTKHFISKLPPVTYLDMQVSAEIHLRSLKPKFSQQTAFALHQAPTVVAHIRKELDLNDKELLALYFQFRAEDAEKKSETPGTNEGIGPVDEPSQGATPTT
jgi:hypothetical protein